jgi:hypothetical protein
MITQEVIKIYSEKKTPVATGLNEEASAFRLSHLNP